MSKNYILSFLLTMFIGALSVNAQSETVMDFPNAPIPDNNPTGISVTLTVTNNFVMTDVDVHVEANHTWIGDLIFDITSPSGTTVRIIDRPGVPNTAFGCSSNGPDVTLDDDALDPIETTCLTTNDTIAGTYSPNNPLSAFNGENSAGIWTLTVSDHAGGDTGNLLSWGITFSYSGGCIQDELTTVPFLSGNQFAGNMFNITASGGADILIEKFDINIGVGSASISVFSRPGSYVGFENSSAGWTLMGNETVTGQGSGVPTELNVGGLVIPDGETYGIYITVTDYPSVSMFYTNGDNVFSDSYLTITTGVGKGNPDFTGSTFPSRSWNGTVYYCAGTSFPSPYCGPLDFTTDVEPITRVIVADIDNTSSAVVNGSPAHEDFTSIVGNMIAGDSYPIALEGNTAGNYENRFVVFIDWNQNGILDDPGEVFEMDNTIINSTGLDGQQALGTITVPINALSGETRMRVKKIWGTSNFLNPCSGASFGQAEDYTINVSVGTPPPNDLIQNAISVTNETQPYTDPSVNLQFATLEPFNPSGCSLTGANGVWYSFTAPAAGLAEAHLTSPNGLTALVFYSAPSENVSNETELTYVPGADNPCALGSSSSITTTAGQSYYIFVMNTGGASDVVIDISQTMSIEDNTIDGFTFYPNPVENVLNLKSNVTIDKVELFSVLGQSVLTRSIEANNSQIDVSRLTTGVYLMKVTAEGQTATYQVIKK